MKFILRELKLAGMYLLWFIMATLLDCFLVFLGLDSNVPLILAGIAFLKVLDMQIVPENVKDINLVFNVKKKPAIEDASSKKSQKEKLCNHS